MLGCGADGAPHLQHREPWPPHGVVFEQLLIREKLDLGPLQRVEHLDTPHHDPLADPAPLAQPRLVRLHLGQIQPMAQHVAVDAHVRDGDGHLGREWGCVGVGVNGVE